MIGKIGYLFDGLFGRLRTGCRCPGCGSADAAVVDRKYFHSLRECARCRLLFRHPADRPAGVTAFYQSGYAEPGLTTELPDDAALSRLIASGFAGSEKDFSYHIRVLTALGLKPGDRVLDYGANWGYMTWQFRRAGFDTTAFEISAPRAAFGRKLGVEIHTSLDAVGDGFDVVYSCHVLEHVPDPAAALRQQLALARPGGLVAGHTPNGSRAYRERHRSEFRRTWGKVHPVLLTDEFVAHVAGRQPFLTTSDDRPDEVATWPQTTQARRDTSGGGFFFALRRVDESASGQGDPFSPATR